MKAIIKYSHCGSLILIMGLLDCVLVTWETISKMTGFDWNGAIMSSSSSRSPSKGNLVSVNKYLSCFILLLSTDINLSPGPPAKAIKCQVCFKTIRRNQTSATCCQCIMQISIRTNFHTGISEMTLSITCQFCTGSNDSTISNAFDETELTTVTRTSWSLGK